MSRRLYYPRNDDSLGKRAAVSLVRRSSLRRGIDTRSMKERTRGVWARHCRHLARDDDESAADRARNGSTSLSLSFSLSIFFLSCRFM